MSNAINKNVERGDRIAGRQNITFYAKTFELKVISKFGVGVVTQNDDTIYFKK